MIYYNADRIILARESEGYTQAQLARSLKNVSPAKLNKIEKRQIVPTDEIMEEIAGLLGYPISFFQKQTGSFPYLKEFYFRRNLGIPNKQRIAFEAQMTIIAEHIDTLLDAIEMDVRVPYIDLVEENVSPERIAQKIRSFLNIENGPIRSIIDTIQRLGVIVHFFVPPYSIKIDGVSFITRKGYPIILINESISDSRKVFTIAHELGHLILHYKYMVSDNRDVEGEANLFASELLMPSIAIKTSLYNLDIQKLCNLKAYWRVSLKSLLYRANSLSCVTKDQYRRWMMKYNANKWYLEEPYEFSIEKPTLLNKIFNLYFTRLEYTEEELLDLLDLSEDKIIYFYGLNEVNIRFSKRSPKLKLLL